MALVEGDEIKVVEATGRKLVIEKDERHKAALADIAALNWTLPADYKFDRNEANERFSEGGLQ